MNKNVEKVENVWLVSEEKLRQSLVLDLPH